MHHFCFYSKPWKSFCHVKLPFSQLSLMTSGQVRSGQSVWLNRNVGSGSGLVWVGLVWQNGNVGSGLDWRLLAFFWVWLEWVQVEYRFDVCRHFFGSGLVDQVFSALFRFCTSILGSGRVQIGSTLIDFTFQTSRGYWEKRSLFYVQVMSDVIRSNFQL